MNAEQWKEEMQFYENMPNDQRDTDWHTTLIKMQESMHKLRDIKGNVPWADLGIFMRSLAKLYGYAIHPKDEKLSLAMRFLGDMEQMHFIAGLEELATRLRRFRIDTGVERRQGGMLLFCEKRIKEFCEDMTERIQLQAMVDTRGMCTCGRCERLVKL